MKWIIHVNSNVINKIWEAFSIMGLKPHNYIFVIFVPGLQAGAIEKQSIIYLCAFNGIRFHTSKFT